MRSPPLIIAVLALLVLIVSACGTGRAPARVAPATPPPARAPYSGGGGGTPFETLAGLAQRYNASVFAPPGVPIGPPTEVQATNDRLEQYGYWIFAGAGSVFVFGPAPANVQDFQAAAGVDPQAVVLRQTIVQVQGRRALLVEDQLKGRPGVATFRLLWSQDGQLIQAAVFSLGIAGTLVTPGPDALIAFAERLRSYTPASVGAAGILTVDIPSPAADAQLSSAKTAAEATRLLGAPVVAPSAFDAITVLRAGPIRSYTVDLNAAGTRRLYTAVAPPPTATAERARPGVETAQDVTVRGAPALYEKIGATAGSTSLLYFHVGGTQLLLEDTTGVSAPDLVAVAATIGTQQDATAPAIGVGAPALVGGAVQVPVTTIGSGLASYSGFSFHLRWDPAVFTYRATQSTGSVIASPICLSSVDADGAGVIYSCSSNGGGGTTAAGVLGSVVLTPAASGCSALHLFTLDGADAGNTTTGTYTIDATSGDPQNLPTIDGSADVRGTIC